MADIDKISVNNTTYNIKDSTARDSISQHIPSGAYAGDLNNANTPGIVYASSSAANLPGTSGGMLVIAYASNSARVQLFVENASNPGLYVRRGDNSGWQSWVKVAPTT